MSTGADKLIALFSAAGWKRFVTELVRYRNRGKPLPASVSISNPTDDERRCYARLLRLKKQPEGSLLRCDLRRIADALGQQGIQIDWLVLLEAMCGPEPAEVRISQQNQRAWEDFWATVEALAVLQTFPRANDWMQSLRRDGSLLRLSKGNASLAAERLHMACQVLAHLPLDDEPLPSAAARLCGNSHALDPDSPLSTLILRNLAMQRLIPMPDRSDARRELWEQFGVICDDLSAPVLTFNLELAGSSGLCRLVAEAAGEAQPLHLTNRMITATDWSTITCPRDVFVCENPTVLALAANRLRHACPPMVCVNGEPRSTSRALLRRLRERCSTLWYHGDFDWPGVSIAGRIISEFQAKPLLFGEEDYLEAIKLGRNHPMMGHSVETPWSPSLCDAMRKHGLAVDEEAVIDLLLLAFTSQSTLCE